MNLLRNSIKHFHIIFFSNQGSNKLDRLIENVEVILSSGPGISDFCYQLITLAQLSFLNIVSAIIVFSNSKDA